MISFQWYRAFQKKPTIREAHNFSFSLSVTIIIAHFKAMSIIFTKSKGLFKMTTF